MAGCLGERAGCVVGERVAWLLLRTEHTVRHSELPEHLCSGQLDGLLGESFVVWQLWPWQLLASTRWGARNACPLTWRVATQMAATKAAVQTGTPEAAMQAAAPEAAM